MTKIESKENTKQDAFIDEELLEYIWVTAEEQGSTNIKSLYVTISDQKLDFPNNFGFCFFNSKADRNICLYPLIKEF